MRLQLVLFGLLLIFKFTLCDESNTIKEELEDNEFAEFEDFDESDVEFQTQDDKTNIHTSKAKPEDTEQEGDVVETESDVVVSQDDEESDHLKDEEEFEGFDNEGDDAKVERSTNKDQPKITITNVPLHLRTSWDSYYLEMMMILGILVYFLNFMTGRARNQKLALTWLESHRSLLEENFSLVGDDLRQEIQERGLVKEAEHLYMLWCSGRACCEGMLVELKFIKRQDLLSVMTQMVRPSSDQIQFSVELKEMDPFVLCIASKKTAVRLARDMHDISCYCPERRSGEKFSLPASFSIMSEIAEASAVLDSKVVALINKVPEVVDFLHISDQFSGPKPTEETNNTKLPEIKKMLICNLNIPLKGRSTSEAIEQIKPFLQLIFHLIDKLSRYRLSKEGKARADKNRARVEAAFMTRTHAARAEAAAARREERRRAEKERILQEDDPEKQRKWEDREAKRQLKRRAPKMKQLKVKAL